ncbi:hypothetical protein [Streptomyces sp. NPDC002640]
MDALLTGAGADDGGRDGTRADGAVELVARAAALFAQAMSPHGG